MPISFSQADRIAISRRMVNIAIENSSFAQSSAFFDTQSAKLLGVDGANKKFSDFYDSICKSYENEYRQINGKVAAVYTEGQASPYIAGDVVDSAKLLSTALFFPTTPTAYQRLLPLISDGSFVNNATKGLFYPTSTDARREINILTNTNEEAGLAHVLFRIQNGISASPSVSQSTTATSIPAGDISNYDVIFTDSSPSQLLAGQYVYIKEGSGSSSGLYLINSVSSTFNMTFGHYDIDINISSVISSQVSLSNVNFNNTVPAFTQNELQTLISANYSGYLGYLTTVLAVNLVTEWQGKLQSQQASLTANAESRPTQSAQNTAALVSVNSLLSDISAWLALPNTGVNGKFIATDLNPIVSDVTARVAALPARQTQIEQALGADGADALIQSGENFSATDQTNPYYQRFNWINIRLNKAFGSLRRYFQASDSKGAVDNLSASNIMVQNNYALYFDTKKVIFNDGSNIIHVENVTGFSVSDSVFIVSDTQPEIVRNIVAIMGTTQLQLDQPVSKDYKVLELARVYKQL